MYGYPNNIFQTNPNFKNEASISGADGVLRTSDDGLSLLPNSVAINYGQLTDAPTDDITNWFVWGILMLELMN
ncbi:hypothetical protein DBR28_15790 [Chryseobacterium sp. HMWF028]|nr:hypothetical protein DBR28_15790 [Chryseobacterium sp. HMWF028]